MAKWSLYFRVAWRNIWRHTRRTIIVMLTVSLGVMLLVFYDGFLAGMEQAIFGNAVKLFGGNIQIHAEGYRQKAKRNPLLPLNDPGKITEIVHTQPNVVSVAMRINTGGMTSNEEGSFPVTITGIQPEEESKTNLIAKNIIAGRFLQGEDTDFILIGAALAERMDVTVGDRITLTGSATHDRMRQRSMRIVGIYKLGLPAVEKSAIYITLTEAQNLFGLRGQATEVAISLEQVGQEEPIIDVLQRAFPDYEVDSWQDTNPELRQTLQVNESTMGIFSLILALIAGIGVLNLMLMAVFERTREIGLLGALGLKQREITALFLIEGVLLGVLGSILGLILGYLLILWLAQVGVNYGDMAEMTEFTALMGSRAYPSFALAKSLERAGIVALVSMLASIYPAREAAVQEPVHALHHI